MESTIMFHMSQYKQEMDNMKFCDCGCILANNEYKCDDCKEEW